MVFGFFESQIIAKDFPSRAGNWPPKRGNCVETDPGSGLQVYIMVLLLVQLGHLDLQRLPRVRRWEWSRLGEER
jgi:hypothetical protein